MNLSLKQLRVFREVMHLGSVSAAARALNRTQPAVSAMLAGLEQELGYALFERRRGRLLPRPEAHYFLEEVEAVLERLSGTVQRMQELGTLERGRLRIACMPAASSFLMPRLISEFVRERPSLDVSLRMQSSQVLEEWVASQQYDIGLAETPSPRPALRIRPFHLTCLCAVHTDDPLAALEVITPRDLDGAPMAALYPEHQTRQHTAAAFAHYGVS
ncbi:MAG: LysR substrate-binding domain-containing protein [Arhodomonas sp.]|nr:LysR substrate-binding domain-containing protein [Arhodomonas sp.]